MFAPPRTVGSLVGAGLLAALLALDAVCLALLRSMPINASTFFLILWLLFSLPALAFIAYRLFGLATARYHLDRNGLRIRWGLSLEVLPISEIQAMRSGAEIDAALLPRGLWWPGCVVGQAEVAGIGRVEFFAASGPERMVLVSTRGRGYAISPADPDAFLQLFRNEDQMGALEPLQTKSRRPAPIPAEIWSDRWARALLLGGLFALLALLALITTLYPSFPAEVPLHFNALGLVDQTGPADRLFILPSIGAATWGVNMMIGMLAFRGHRWASYWLWAGAVIVQLLAWTAAIHLLNE